jgi:hypothetical protein
MTEREPKYWGTWKGRVISAIVKGGTQTWTELLEKTGLNQISLNRVLSELYEAGAIKKTPRNDYRVSRNLYDEYKAFFRSGPAADVDETKEQRFSARFAQISKNELIDWIEQWRRLRKLDFTLGPKHFFLEGRHLDDLSKELICRAKVEVLAVNPYVDDCDLSNTLRDASKHARVELVTHPPDSRNQSPKERQEYHDTLRKEGVRIIYNKKVHAKLIVVDRAVAIASSMNFYSGSSGGASWEAGLVSMEDTVVESVSDSILRLKERPESKELR